MNDLVIEVTLPADLAEQAKHYGLLTSPALQRLLTQAIERQQAIERFFEIADQLSAQPASDLDEAAVVAEVRSHRHNARPT